MVTLAIGAHELNLLLLLSHSLDLVSYLVDHDHFLRSWLSLTENVLTWKFDSTLWETREIWRDLLEINVLLSHIALNQEVIFDVLHYLDLFKQIRFSSLLIAQVLFPLTLHDFL